MNNREQIGGAMTTKQFAAKIADVLFTNGDGQKAQRLVLELPKELSNGGLINGGGWSQEAVVYHIDSFLKENLFWRLEMRNQE